MSATSQTKFWSELSDDPNPPPNCELTVRARVHKIRAQAKIIFMAMRLENQTAQYLFFKSEHKQDTIDYVLNITKESIVDVTAIAKKAEPIVKSCTIQYVEFVIKAITVVSAAPLSIPIQIDEHIYLPEKTKGDDPEKESKLDTRLNNRVLDLRKADNQLIFRLQAATVKIFRDFLDGLDFMEIHTPKLIGTASEGGSNVFEVKYFGKAAYLAQSPQLYKQMAICADFPLVYEIGPVFRAEKSFTHRHLTEFTGFDIEMVINNDYHEVMRLLDDMFVGLFHNIKALYGTQIEKFWKDFGVEPFEYQMRLEGSPVIPFREAVQLLRDAGYEMGDCEDFNTEKEKALGRIVKEKYHSDFFIVDQFPTSIRPFYTMKNPHDPVYSNSYDFFMRGEEVLSGAQRINDYNTLLASAQANGIDTAKIADYLEAFRYGTPVHGGGGIGLERVIMLYLGINNIRNTSMFPRDPSRIAP